MRNNVKSTDSQQESNEVMTFNFSESQGKIRSLIIDKSPWVVAKDICDVLEISNSRDALIKLDDDEKLMSVLPTSGQNRKMWLVNESGLYALIMRSNKPQAKVFRKWVTSEVLPAIRKKGRYVQPQSMGEYIDARDIPCTRMDINHTDVRCITVEGQTLVSIGDLHSAIRSGTCTIQAVKRLNAKQVLAHKVWVFGSTRPAWFTTELGVKLLLSGSRVLKTAYLLDTPIITKGGQDDRL